MGCVSWKKRLPGRFVALGFGMLLLCGTGLRAQTPGDAVPAWQKAAGGTLEFEVASVREDKGPFRPPSFALSSDDWFRDPHGRFHSDFSVATYVEFAYKLWLTGEQRKAMLAGVPEWVSSARYAIEATAPEHATKDQYRLMMQAMLAERFHLKIHFTEKEEPVLAMTLVKAGTPGPKLIAHDKGPSCEEKPGPDVFPGECYSFSAYPKDGHTLVGSRGTSMELIGQFLGNMGGRMGEISRPVVDETGLTGKWDFTVEIGAPFGGPKPDAPAPEGPTLLEAMQEQLGIKLKATKAVLQTPVVDQLERPSEN